MMEFLMKILQVSLTSFYLIDDFEDMAELLLKCYTFFLLNILVSILLVYWRDISFFFPLVWVKILVYNNNIYPQNFASL